MHLLKPLPVGSHVPPTHCTFICPIMLNSGEPGSRGLAGNTGLVRMPESKNVKCQSWTCSQLTSATLPLTLILHHWLCEQKKKMID